MTSMAFVLTLKALRTKAGMSQAALADAVGVRIATISDLENDNSRRIEFDLLESLCDVFSRKLKKKIQPNDLFKQVK